MTDQKPDWKSLSYHDANRILQEYENDYQNYTEENKSQAQEWWTDEKRVVKTKIAEMRQRLNTVNGNAPDAWGEMKDAWGAAMAEFSDGYNRSIRALKK